MSEFDYVKMLEVPINSCSVVEKPSKRRKSNVKKQVIDKVNMTAQEQPSPATAQEKRVKKLKRQKGEKPVKIKRAKLVKKESGEEKSVQIKNGGFDIVSVQVVTIFVLIVGIILTNIFWEDSGINNIMRSVFNQTSAQNNAAYSTFSANLPTKTDDVTLENGVMTVSSGSVYSPCDGSVESIFESDGLYTITIRHSNSFSTVVSGVENVYACVSEKVYANIPIGHSSGEFSVSMFDGDAILTNYVLSDNQIVWLG